jgi:hypothetical protein
VQNPLVDFDAYTAELVERCRSTAGVMGLILVGSTTDERSAARDSWSDHDFYVVLADGSQEVLRRELPFLPFRDDVVTVARDGLIGASVLYSDGHILEFAAATESELGQFPLGHHQVVYGSISIERLVREAVDRGASRAGLDPADEASLALIKLLIGVGRARRGELINGGSFVRTYVIGHVAAAIVHHLPVELAPARDGLDVVRRFEEAYPSISRPLGLALDEPLERAARSVFSLMRTVLEPGWDAFPSAAADVVARELGWS